MLETFGVIEGLLTLALMLAFVGIVAWAWSAKRKAGFDEAARLPLEDDDLDRRPRG